MSTYRWLNCTQFSNRPCDCGSFRSQSIWYFSATVKFTPWLVFSVLLLMMYTHLNNLSSWGLMDLSCRPPTCTPMRRRNSRNVVPRCSVFVSGSKHGSFVLIIVHAHNSNRRGYLP